MATGNWTDPKCGATATGKRPDRGSVQFGPMHISSPVDWTCEHYAQVLLHPSSLGKTLAQPSYSCTRITCLFIHLISAYLFTFSHITQQLSYSVMSKLEEREYAHVRIR